MSGDVDRVARFLLKPFARACKEFDLLARGDRVAVAVSGGKDSRALLDLLLRYRERVPYSYDLIAVHVVGTTAGFPDLRTELEKWFREIDVQHSFVPLDLPEGEPLPLDCHRCAWNRRKALFTAAARLGCNKLALGHHADDAAVATLMSLLYGGRLETMAPRISFFDSAVTIVRPLIYVPEKKLADYAQAVGLYEYAACPQAQTSSRARMKALLRGFGRAQRQIRANLWRAARREMEF
jgi:tRNA 2-thiocytidine biosynthesis protein TtcA